jgi:hypothetical protein
MGLMELLQAYLLNELPEENAEAVELKYFRDRTFLCRVEEAESALIEDYLDGRLTPARRRTFEERYLEAPELSARVEAVRSRRRAVDAAPRWAGMGHYTPALAMALLLVTASGVWLAHRPAGQPVPAQPVEPVVAAIVVPLSPGLVKGSGTAAEFAIPSAGNRVALTLEVPGARMEQDYSVRVFLVNADGQKRLVWANPQPVRPVSGPQGQTLRVEVEAKLFTAGDYIVEAASRDGQIRETYVCRANPAH